LQEVKSTRDKFSNAASYFVAEKVDEADHKLDHTVKSIKTVPKKISKILLTLLRKRLKQQNVVSKGQFLMLFIANFSNASFVNLILV